MPCNAAFSETGIETPPRRRKSCSWIRRCGGQIAAGTPPAALLPRGSNSDRIRRHRRFPEGLIREIGSLGDRNRWPTQKRSTASARLTTVGGSQLEKNSEKSNEAVESHDPVVRVTRPGCGALWDENGRPLENYSDCVDPAVPVVPVLPKARLLPTCSDIPRAPAIDAK